MPLVAGVDSSTQSTKVVLVDVDDGAVVTTGRAPHDVHRDGAASESDPDGWWDALGRALSATGRAGDVAAISIAGQQHGLVVTDRSLRPLRPALLWNDTRSAPDAQRLRDRMGDEWWLARTGLRPVASFTATKWAWLRRVEPATAAAAEAVHLPHDHLTGRLTGRASTDRGDASGTLWWSPADGEYLAQVLDLLGLDPTLLAQVVGPADTAGTVTATAAAALGLRPGIPVAAGTGDNMAAALGLGVPAGWPVVSLGTSGTAYAVVGQPVRDRSGTLAGFASADGRHLPLAATLNCTTAVDTIAAWLGLDREDVAVGEVVVLPYLDGERTPDLPGASGLIDGLRSATTRQEILWGAYVGAAASLVGAVDVLHDLAGVPRDTPLTLIGGGARGGAWVQVFRRSAGRVVRVPRPAEHVALGAAVQAAAALGGEVLSDVQQRWRGEAAAEHAPIGDGAAQRESVGALLAANRGRWGG